MSLAVRMLAEPIRSLAAASIGGAYMGIGTGLEFPSRLIYVLNSTDAQLMFSIDGINDHFTLPEGGFLLLDISSNQSHTQGMYLSVGQRLYVREIGTPTEGSVYFSTFYGANSPIG